MSKLTKKPNQPVLSQLSKTLVAGAVLVGGCNTVGVPEVTDSGPADAMTQMDASNGDAGMFVGVPPAPEDGGADAPAPPPGVPPAPEDAGADVE